MNFDFTPIFESVEVLGRTYYVRALGLDELLDYEKRNEKRDGKEPVGDFLSLVLCDEKGERLSLSLDDIGRIPLPIALKMKAAALKVNGLADEEDDAGKAPSSSSPSP